MFSRPLSNLTKGRRSCSPTEAAYRIGGSQSSWCWEHHRSMAFTAAAIAMFRVPLTLPCLGDEVLRAHTHSFLTIVLFMSYSIPR
jgi:hypothetical protein